MSEPPVKTSSPPSASSQTTHAATADDEPLQHLYKMSRTAGLGDTEYVAVNGTSVAALIFGIGSALVVFDPIFLIVPLVAVFFAVLSLRQVKRSNGTQTGRGLAWTAIAVALLCTAVLGSKQIFKWLDHRHDEQAINDLMTAFGSDLAAKNYDAAYARLSPGFTERVSPEMFRAKFTELEAAEDYYGTIKGIESTNFAAFDVDNRTSEPLARSMALIKLKNVRGEDDRQEFIFRKHNGKWMVEGIPVLFPPEVKILKLPNKT